MDWIGDTNSVFKTLGASSHSDDERQNEDFYATDPKAGEMLMELEKFNNDIWECSAGMGHLSKVFEKYGYNVKSTDLIDRGYGEFGVDFLSKDIVSWHGDIITNPPYKYAKEFIEKALEIIPTGNKVAMFLKLQFLEGKARKKLFMIHPPRTVYISSSRIECGMNGEFKNTSAVAYCWYIWEKGFKGNTELKWFN